METIYSILYILYIIKNYVRNKNVPKDRQFVSGPVNYGKLGEPNLSNPALDENGFVPHGVF